MREHETVGAGRFRPATPGDVDAVVGWMAAYYAEDGYPFEEPRTRAELRRFLADPSLGALWVAELGGVVAGYLVVTLGYSFEYGGRDAFLDELYLGAPYRGQRLGAEALALAEAYCRSQGVRALHLEVEAHRERAAALYARRGFVHHARTLMTKRL